MTTIEKQVARLEYLSQMLSKYRNAYYRAMDKEGDLSPRMNGWLDEYNEASGSPAWNSYCVKHGFSPRHDAGDIFA